MSEIRLLILDDHILFRESLGRLLETTPDLRVVSQCATVNECLDALSRGDFDVILLDYDLGAELGTDLLPRLGEGHSRAKVLMVTAGLSDEMTLRAMERGVSGIFLKHNSPDLLVTAIRQVAAGGTWLDNAALQRLLSVRRAHGQISEQSALLTPRQTAVLRGILDGLANKEIAWKLDISESSVKSVIQDLFRKAGVRTRSQLVRIAIEKHTSDWLKPLPKD
jgi:two-component system, NarL family, nitrate/nitrite response regulator NarL